MALIVSSCSLLSHSQIAVFQIVLRTLSLVDFNRSSVLVSPLCHQQSSFLRFNMMMDDTYDRCVSLSSQSFTVILYVSFCASICCFQGPWLNFLHPKWWCTCLSRGPLRFWRFYHLVILIQAIGLFLALSIVYAMYNTPSGQLSPPVLSESAPHCPEDAGVSKPVEVSKPVVWIAAKKVWLLISGLLCCPYQFRLFHRWRLVT